MPVFCSSQPHRPRMSWRAGLCRSTLAGASSALLPSISSGTRAARPELTNLPSGTHKRTNRMDYENIKSVFPLLGGALALAGGVFTFVNGRLNEAKTEESRTFVISMLIFAFVCIANLSAVLTLMFIKPLASIPLYILVLMAETISYVRRGNILTRWSIVSYCLLSCIICCNITLIAAGSWIDQVREENKEIYRTLRMHEATFDRLLTTMERIINQK